MHKLSMSCAMLTPAAPQDEAALQKSPHAGIQIPFAKLIVCLAAAVGEGEGEEAEYAWLQAESLKPFSAGDTSGNPDGVLSGDPTLQACVAAADRALQVSSIALLNLTESRWWARDPSSKPSTKPPIKEIARDMYIYISGNVCQHLHRLLLRGPACSQ